ncbi:MAG: hypothetical protein KJ955_05880 [Nanoarchaeota archaeon]|nr:hypothetical protein [Nanoarchaeota archaeon]
MARKKAEKPETPDDSIHVRLDTPMGIRKEVLSLAVDVISLLKRYYEYIDTKKHKDDLMKLLRADVNEIKRLTKELNVEELPLSMGELKQAHAIEEPVLPEKKPAAKKEEKLKEELPKKEKKAPEQARVLPKEPARPAKRQPQDKLESELAELKSLISRL